MSDLIVFLRDRTEAADTRGISYYFAFRPVIAIGGGN